MLKRLKTMLSGNCCIANTAKWAWQWKSKDELYGICVLMVFHGICALMVFYGICRLIWFSMESMCSWFSMESVCSYAYWFSMESVWALMVFHGISYIHMMPEGGSMKYISNLNRSRPFEMGHNLADLTLCDQCQEHLGYVRVPFHTCSL